MLSKLVLFGNISPGLLEGTAIVGKGVVRRSDSSLSIGGVDGMDAYQAKYSVTGPEGGWNPSLDKSHNQARGSPFGKESLGF